MKDYNPSLHNVKIQTWGTEDKQSNGINSFIEQSIFGGNIGHASLVMSLPINEDTKKWMELYCFKKTFAQYKATLSDEQQEYLTFENYVERVGKRIPSTLTAQNTYQYSEDGTPITPRSEVKSFQIEFSWWPDDDETSFSLSNTEDDRVRERLGKHFEYSESAKEYLRPEERLHSGVLSGQVMTYAPLSIVHRRDLSDSQFERITMKLELEKITEHLELKEFLFSKIDEMNTVKIDGSLKLLCNNIGLNSDELLTKYLEENPGEEDINQFKKFFMDSAEQHFEALKQTQSSLKCKLKDLVQETKYRILEEIFFPDIDKLSTIEIDDNLKLNCKKIGLNTEELIKVFLNSSYGDSSIDQFKDFLRIRIELKLSDEKKRDDLFNILEDSKKESEYITKGIPPDHVITLPYSIGSERGLSPEAMLKKMHELTKPGAEKYDILSQNCSTTSTTILAAGVENDALLKHTLSKQALGCCATPQQVLDNVKKVMEIISADKKETLRAQTLTRAATPANLPNKLNDDTQKQKTISSLKRYIDDRTAEYERTNKKFNNILTNLFPDGREADQKISAANKCLNVLGNELYVSFTKEELKTLANGRLGNIINQNEMLKNAIENTNKAVEQISKFRNQLKSLKNEDQQEVEYKLEFKG